MSKPTKIQKTTRLAIVDPARCKPSQCHLECKRACPINKQHKQCIIVDKLSKVSYIDERLCIGCGACAKRCPFDAITIVNLPGELDNPVFRYGPNLFKLFGLPILKRGVVVGLVGTNGIGKSTVLQILAGACKPNFGDDDCAWADILKRFAGSELQLYFTKLLEEKKFCALKEQYVDKLPEKVKKEIKKKFKREVSDWELIKNKKTENNTDRIHLSEITQNTTNSMQENTSMEPDPEQNDIFNISTVLLNSEDCKSHDAKQSENLQNEYTDLNAAKQQNPASNDLISRFAKMKVRTQKLEYDYNPIINSLNAALQELKDDINRDLTVRHCLAVMCEKRDPKLIVYLCLDHLLDRTITDLSGGELQRLAICLTLQTNAKSYFFDEMTSFLDIKQRLYCAQAIRDLVESPDTLKPYVLIVEHDLAIQDYLCDVGCVLYGKPGAYGVLSFNYTIRQCINSFLEGYLQGENVKFRNEPLKFMRGENMDQNEQATHKYEGYTQVFYKKDNKTKNNNHKQNIVNDKINRSDTKNDTKNKDDTAITNNKQSINDINYISGNTEVDKKDINSGKQSTKDKKNTSSNTEVYKKDSNNGKQSTNDNNNIINNTKDDLSSICTATINKQLTNNSCTRTTLDSNIVNNNTNRTATINTDNDNIAFQLQIMPGYFSNAQIVVFLGENGMGKSTYVKLLAGLYAHKPFTAFSVSYKPQMLSPKYTGTVRTLFMSKIKDAMLDMFFVEEVLKPLSINYILDSALTTLSGGELQRVAIVMCLGKHADIYLLDEPSAYLDAEQRITICKVLRRFILQKNKAAFIVEHDFIVATYLADKVILFEGQPGKYAVASEPLDLKSGMNRFLHNLDVTFRRDAVSCRPRVNKKNSAKDREQREKGEYFY